MLIRKSEMRDFKNLERLYFHARKKLPWIDQRFVSVNDFRKDTEGETIWVGEIQQDIVAFVSVWIQENFIHHLYLQPGFEGKGYGSQLLASCIEEIGLPARLKCNSKNERALSFYQRLGWKTESSGMGEDGEYQLMVLSEHNKQTDQGLSSPN